MHAHYIKSIESLNNKLTLILIYIYVGLILN